MRKKGKKGLPCTSAWLPIPQGWSHPSSMNLPGRQSNNCNKVQLKSLRALERKINFVTMHNTYSDVSGTVMQGENQLSGTEGWGKSGVTPPKALELHWHKTVTREGSTRPWEPTNKSLQTRHYWPQIRIKSNAQGTAAKSRSERTQRRKADTGKGVSSKITI